MSKQAKLDQIKADILQQNICPNLGKTSKNLVFGTGNPNASIVFIGEAPGKKEDETGLPFVGTAGKYLDSLLDGINLNRTDIYITNIVKYRPPNNRDPLPKEKQDFMPFLFRQLEVIQPNIVVTLGRHSMESFLPGQTIGNRHGQLHSVTTNYGNTPTSWSVLPLYHPAAALYNGSLRQTLSDDFQVLSRYLTTMKAK